MLEHFEGDRRMKFKLIVLLGSICLLASALVMPADAQGNDAPSSLNQRQLDILQTVRATDGYINQELHGEFWQLFPSFVRTDPDFPRLFSEMLADISGPRHDFQRQTWLSARASLKAGRIVKTPAYVASAEAVRTASTNPGYQTSVENSIASAERLVAAAATGRPLEVRGQRTFVTADMIEQVLSGIEASEFRLSKLLSPAWNGSLTKFDYPEAHVSVLAVTPYTLELKSIATPETGTLRMVMLSQTRGPSTVVGINFNELNRRFRDPVSALTSNARAAIDGAGTEGGRPVYVKWRGMDSATATGSAQTSEGDIFIAVRVVEVPEISGVLQFFAVSQLSIADAMNERGILEGTTRILR
jgi:hypothetical protein